MADPIVSETQQHTVSTSHETGDTAAQWLGKHVDRVRKAIQDGNFPIDTAARIATNWPTDVGPSPHERITIRRTGPPPETDSQFLDRHFAEVAADMVNYPPVP